MKKFLVLLACTALLCGCAKTDSNIVNPESETKVGDPDFDVRDDINIDWQQVSTDAEEIFNNKTDYPYSEDFHFMLQPNSKEVMLVWVVSDDLPTSQLESYAENLIKGFNDVVAVQDFSIEKSSADSFGGLWKDCGLSYGIAPLSTQDDEDTWFLRGNFAAGESFTLPDVEGILKQADEAEQTADSTETADSSAEAE